MEIGKTLIFNCQILGFSGLYYQIFQLIISPTDY